MKYCRCCPRLRSQTKVKSDQTQKERSAACFQSKIRESGSRSNRTSIIGEWSDLSHIRGHCGLVV